MLTPDGTATLFFTVAADEAACDVKANNSLSVLFLFAVDLHDLNAAIGPDAWRVRWTAVHGDAIALAVVMMMDA